MLAGRRGGFTIAEVLLASTMAAILLAMSSRFLVTSFNLSTQGALMTTMEGQAVFAFQHMLRDLQKTTSSALAITPSNQGFSLVHMSTLTSLRTLVWEQQLVVYWFDPSTARVMTETWPPKPPDLGLVFDLAQPPHVTPDNLQEILSNPNATAHCLANDVADFSLTPQNGSDYFQLSIHLSVVVGNKPASYELTRLVCLRNHL